MNIPVISPILFHHWQHGDKDHARFVMESVCRNGLLLTTNTQSLDSFAIDRGQGVVSMDVMQNPRVCFTDIPFELLSAHGMRYGKFAIGFRRETIIEWGGIPAWYLPNHWSDTSLKLVAPTLVNGLHMAMDAVKNFKEFSTYLKSTYNYDVIMGYSHGQDLSGANLQDQLQFASQAISLALSYVKEMSPSKTEDYRYLDEREWRIVAGIGLTGQLDTYRKLIEQEKQLFCNKRPEWREAITSKDINVTTRYTPTPIIDSFRIFNGLPGKQSVAQMVDTILVPDETERQWVANFVRDNFNIFGNKSPNVEIFPSNQY